jgi:hypothetical protein
VVVMSMRFCLLCPTCDRSLSSCAALFVPSFFFLHFPPLTTCRSTLGHLYAGFLRRSVVIPAKRTGVAVCKLSSRRNRARYCADAATNPRKHTSKLAFDSRFTGWAGELGLCSLYGLRKGRNAAFAVDLLDP